MGRYEWPPSSSARSGHVAEWLQQRIVEDWFAPGQLIAQAIEARAAYLELLESLHLVSEQDTWLPLGPSTTISGSNQSGVDIAGQIRDLKVMDDGSRAYAASANGGVWYSSDEGRSWSPLGAWGLQSDGASASRAANSLTIGALDVHFGTTPDQDVVYAATGVPEATGSAGGNSQPGGIGILRLDGTVTAAIANPGNIPWKREGRNLGGLGVYRLAHDPAADLAFAESGTNTLLAATSNGLYSRSGAFVENGDWARVSGVAPFTFNADAGIACADVIWTATTTAPARPSRLWVAIVDPHGGKTDVYTSTNGLAGPFQRVNLPGRADDGCLTLAAAPGHPEVVYILGKQANRAASVWRVDVDTNLTARVVRNIPIGLFGPVTPADNGSLQVVHDQAYYDIALAVDLSDANIIYVGGAAVWTGDWNAALYKLTIGGSAASDNFQADFLNGNQRTGSRDATYIGDGAQPNVHTIAHTTAGVWIGCDGGVFVQAQGSMQSRNSGLATIDTRFTDSHPALDGPVIAGAAGTGRIERVGDTVWRIWGFGDGGGTAYHIAKPSHYVGQYAKALWAANSGRFTHPVLRSTGRAEGMSPSERKEYQAAKLYSGPATIAGADGKSRIAIGSDRVWFSNDWAPDSTGTMSWVTLPSGTDPRAPGAHPADNQDLLNDYNGADWVQTLKWAQGGTETDGHFDGQRLLVLTYQTIRQFTYDAAHDKWSTHNFTDEKKKNRISSNGDIPSGTAEHLPRVGGWTDIAPHDPARGTHGSFYVSATGKSTLSASGALQEADKMDTLWWFDGTDKWYPTGLRNAAPDTGTGTGGCKAPALAVACDTDRPNTTVYVGTAMGVWRGTLSFTGNTPSWEWRGLLEGLPLAAVQDLSIFKNGSLKLLRAALRSRGIWELDISATPNSVGRTYLRACDLDTRRAPLPDPLIDPLTESTALDLTQSPDVYARPTASPPPWGTRLPSESELFRETDRDRRLGAPSYCPAQFEVYVLVHHRHLTPLPGSDAKVLLLQHDNPPNDLSTLQLDSAWRQAVMALFNGTGAAPPAQWTIADAGTPIRSPSKALDARTPRAIRFNADLSHDLTPTTVDQDKCLFLAIVSSSADSITDADLNHPTLNALLRNSGHVAAHRVNRVRPTISLHIDVGWTFTGGAPNGDYTLTLGAQSFTGSLVNGAIRLDQKLSSLTGTGSLEIRVTNGPIFRANVSLDLPPIQTSSGVMRRLTNLGWPAGTGGTFDARTAWAIRAFKRAKMNAYSRNSPEEESDTATQAFLAALQNAYGSQPDDAITGSLAAAFAGATVAATPLGNKTLLRSSFETNGAQDDRDADGSGNNGVWAGSSAAGQTAEIVGGLPLHLRAFDTRTGVPPFSNRVNLPQFVRMTQFVLWELGFWIVGGSGGWSTEGGIQTRLAFTPNGNFDRNCQWAVREFQCWAKSDHAACEASGGAEKRYIHRLLPDSPKAVNGAARYPDGGRASGALNSATRASLDAWAVQRLRCPIVIYSTTDTHNAVANGSNLALIHRENLWLHDDDPSTAPSPRMYALDWSGFYPIPPALAGIVAAGGAAAGATIPRPIVVGYYTSIMTGGPTSLPGSHTWPSANTEVAPGTLIGIGGLNGNGLTAAQLSTFKAVRVSAHFECYSFLDCLNAYDDVCISIPLYHWTLARTSGGAPDEAREMPSVLAKFRAYNAGAYDRAFGRFGLRPHDSWPIAMSGNGTYDSKIDIQTETGFVNLSGVSGTQAFRRENNRYCKTWHSYYRFQMACRTSQEFRTTLWYMGRKRIEDILDKTFTISGVARRTGDIATSEKAVAMLLRWHIYRPAHLFRHHDPAHNRPNYLLEILTTVLNAHAAATQARENALIAEIDTVGSPHTDNAMHTIRGWTNVPQQGTAGARPSYHLHLTHATLSSTLNSFQFDPP